MSIIRCLCRSIASAQREPRVAAATKRLPTVELVVTLHLLWAWQLTAGLTADAMRVVHVVPIEAVNGDADFIVLVASI